MIRAGHIIHEIRLGAAAGVARVGAFAIGMDRSATSTGPNSPEGVRSSASETGRAAETRVCDFGAVSIPGAAKVPIVRSTHPARILSPRQTSKLTSKGPEAVGLTKKIRGSESPRGGTVMFLLCRRGSNCGDSILMLKSRDRGIPRSSVGNSSRTGLLATSSPVIPYSGSLSTTRRSRRICSAYQYEQGARSSDWYLCWKCSIENSATATGMRNLTPKGIPCSACR